MHLRGEHVMRVGRIVSSACAALVAFACKSEQSLGSKELTDEFVPEDLFELMQTLRTAVRAEPTRQNVRLTVIRKDVKKSDGGTPYWDAVRNGARRAGDELGCKVLLEAGDAGHEDC